jgi:ADP-heptose:LPS heptosyltransferase
MYNIPVTFFKKQLLLLRDLQRFLRFYVVDGILRLQQRPSIPQTLLIIHLGGIGDYILFRNFLAAIKSSKRYSDYRITLCVNEACKTVATVHDAAVVTDFIWVNSKKMKSRLSYRWKTLSDIRHRGFETVIYPTYSRDVLTGDAIVRIAGAREAITCNGDNVHSSFWQQHLLNKSYTTLINISSSSVFEFYKNREFVEKLINEKTQIQKLSLPIYDSTEKSEHYAVLCPGALLRKKQWPLERFLQIAEYLFQQHRIKSVLVGDRNDIPSVTLRQEIAQRSYIVNKIAQTSLLETTHIVQDAAIVVTNDTSISHIGVAFGKPVVIVSNGEHYGRFSEYPKEIHPAVFYAYPSEIANSNLSFRELVAKFKYGSRLNIETISVDTVKHLVDKALP